MLFTIVKDLAENLQLCNMMQYLALRLYCNQFHCFYSKGLSTAGAAVCFWAKKSNISLQGYFIHLRIHFDGQSSIARLLMALGPSMQNLSPEAHEAGLDRG